MHSSSTKNGSAIKSSDLLSLHFSIIAGQSPLFLAFCLLQEEESAALANVEA